MWIFTIAPTWAIHLVFTMGLILVIAGFVLGFIPFVKKYMLPIKIIGLLIFSLGLYLEGGLSDYREWEFKAAELEKRVKDAEIKAAKKNVEIQEKIVTKTNTIYKKGDEIIKYIDNVIVKKEEVVKFIENCPIPQAIIDEHNAAALLNKAAEGNKQ